MTGATIIPVESNGAGEVKTDRAWTDDMIYANNDAFNPNPNDYPITPGENSYEKYIKFKCTSIGTMSRVQNFKVWKSSGTIPTYTSIKTNVRETNYANKTYIQPIKAASTQAVRTFPTSKPTGANLGIDGSLSGYIDAVNETSDYLIIQLQTTSSEITGVALVISVEWEEVP